MTTVLPTAEQSAKLHVGTAKKTPVYSFGHGHPMAKCVDLIKKASGRGDCFVECANLCEESKHILTEHGYVITHNNDVSKQHLTNINWCYLTHYKLINSIKSKYPLSW